MANDIVSRRSRRVSREETSAVALKYSPNEDYTPIIVASGHGKVAERIINLADENGIPVYRDDSAAAVLSMLSVGQGVPQELYSVIAGIYVEILAIAREEQ
ncbi:MAG: EscU/YscU/HrcU family type III secretion system export apparatus switch protein [Ruminococcus sp.]|jgi:flagellar biosynthesis protein|nr:EscU/YscU/HrcU family type III secretion system export apparatus switch protein [Ruminococcus sp.]